MPTQSHIFTYYFLNFPLFRYLEKWSTCFPLIYEGEPVRHPDRWARSRRSPGGPVFGLFLSAFWSSAIPFSHKVSPLCCGSNVCSCAFGSQDAELLLAVSQTLHPGKAGQTLTFLLNATASPLGHQDVKCWSSCWLPLLPHTLPPICHRPGSTCSP